MSVSDDGGAPGRPQARQIALALLLVLLVSTAAWLPKFLQTRHQAIADARDWTFAGPRCQSVTETEFRASPTRPTHVFEYSKVTFGRAQGHVSCAEIRYDGGRGLLGGYPVCQFTGPAALEVRTPKGVYYYLTKPGQRATVSTPHGEARCVLAGRFKG